MMVSGVIPGFQVYGFWSAMFGSLLISLVSWLLTSFINPDVALEFTFNTRKHANSVSLQQNTRLIWSSLNVNSCATAQSQSIALK